MSSCSIQDSDWKNGFIVTLNVVLYSNYKLHILYWATVLSNMLVKVASSANLGLCPAISRCFCQNAARSMATTTGQKSEVPVETEEKKKEDKLAIFKGKRFPDFETAYRQRGTGGRSSFNGISTTVFGGGSFVGMSLIARLAKSGSQVVIGYRGSGYFESKLSIAGDLGQIYFAKIHLKDDKSLYEAMRYSNVVVNCIGRDQPTRNFSLADIHIDGPRRMARIAREVGVKKFIHLSAMNASPNPTPVCLKKGSEFLRTKYLGELAVLEEFPDATIMRPADVLGERDDFLNHFTTLQRMRYTYNLPIWDYYMNVVKQPIYVKDLVSGIEKAIFDDSACGKTYQAVGPHRYDFYELIDFMRSNAGMSQNLDGFRITNLRWDILRFIVTFAVMTQKYPFLTWERVERDSTSDILDPKLPTLRDLGVELTPIELIIKELAYHRPRYQRVDIPFELQADIKKPTRLDLVGA